MFLKKNVSKKNFVGLPAQINKKKENFAIWISNKRYLKNLDIFLRQTMLVPWTQFLFYIKMFTKNFNFIRISYY